MTARQMLEALLIELNKVNAPSLLLEDYNYFINKAIYQYINKTYNFNEINQQYTDNVRVLKSTAILEPTKFTGVGKSNLHGATYMVDLPNDYLHMLNCVCVYKLLKKYKCYEKDQYWELSAKRLTGDSWSTILNDHYNRPSYKNPYYYIHNVNKNNDGSLPTNPYSSNNQYGTDFSKIATVAGLYSSDPIKEAIVELLLKGDIAKENITPIKDGSWDNQLENIDVSKTYNANKSVIDEYIKNHPKDVQTYHADNGFPRTITIGGESSSVVERDFGLRYGNPQAKIRCEIRYGKDAQVFELQEVHVDYIKVPLHVCITQTQMDLTEDTSQIMEFPDYVCQEIINELVHIVMENGSNPRLQTHIPVSLSIASPAQQLAAK